MSDFNAENSPEENGIRSPGKDSPSPKDGAKRMSYVSKEHKAVFDFVTILYKELGHSDYHTKEQIAEAHRLSPDTIKTYLGSCQQYGLLEIKHGVGYKVTDLFTRMSHPLNEEEKHKATVESLKSPDLFQVLFKQYEQMHLPEFNGIKNHFLRNAGLRPEAAEKSAEIFLNNIKEYGLVDSKGVLNTDSGNVIQEATIIDPEINGRVDNDRLPATTPRQQIEDIYTGESNKKVPIFLTKKKVAYLVYPDEITEKDIKLIEHQVAGILLRLQLENEENNTEA